MQNLEKRTPHAHNVKSVIKSPEKSQAIAMWMTVLFVYMSLLIAIGYIAFWEQDFNYPENTVGSYMAILTEFRQEIDKTDPVSGEQFSLIVQEMMKQEADAAGDLQELATQSFNIVLGAVLAFLSASVTMFFQQKSTKSE
ncbi:MAG: hypothetical protein HRT53_01880 [Colwellia sp.]|nr:hypothetical protein [Colwellia sp.]